MTWWSQRAKNKKRKKWCIFFCESWVCARRSWYSPLVEEQEPPRPLRRIEILSWYNLLGYYSRNCCCGESIEDFERELIDSKSLFLWLWAMGNKLVSPFPSYEAACSHLNPMEMAHLKGNFKLLCKAGDSLTINQFTQVRTSIYESLALHISNCSIQRRILFCS